MELISQISLCIQPVVEQAKYHIADITLHKQELTVTIEKQSASIPGKREPVTIEDCAKVSRLIDPVLEKANIIPNRYSLIVSSRQIAI